MRQTIGALLLVLLVVAGGACSSGGPYSDEPPWGLDNIEMPDTEGDVAGVFAAFPDEMDGLANTDLQT